MGSGPRMRARKEGSGERERAVSKSAGSIKRESEVSERKKSMVPWQVAAERAAIAKQGKETETETKTRVEAREPEGTHTDGRDNM